MRCQQLQVASATTQHGASSIPASSVAPQACVADGVARFLRSAFFSLSRGSLRSVDLLLATVRVSPGVCGSR